MIKCNITNNIYIGSTTQTLIKRLNNHKRFDCSSYLILMNKDYDIKIIENYECKNEKELLAREQFYIYNRKCINENKSTHIFIDLLPNKNKETFILHLQNNEYKKIWCSVLKKVIQQLTAFQLKKMK